MKPHNTREFMVTTFQWDSTLLLKIRILSSHSNCRRQTKFKMQIITPGVMPFMSCIVIYHKHDHPLFVFHYIMYYHY